MELELDPLKWSSATARSGPEGRDSRADWHGLRARLEAGRAAARALAVANREATASNSFDAASARSMEAWDHGLSAVNPSALGIRKSDARKVDVAVNFPVSGGRG